MAVALFAITAAWDEFLFAFVFINSESLFTLSVGLRNMVAGDIFPWGQMFAASIMTTVPVVVIGRSAGSLRGMSVSSSRIGTRPTSATHTAAWTCRSYMALAGGLLGRYRATG